MVLPKVEFLVELVLRFDAMSPRVILIGLVYDPLVESRRTEVSVAILKPIKKILTLLNGECPSSYIEHERV